MVVEDCLWPLTYRGHGAADWLAVAARHLESLRRGPMVTTWSMHQHRRRPFVLFYFGHLD